MLIFISRAGEDARRRLTWLEDGLSRQFGVNMRSIKTGDNLGEHLTGSSPTPGSHASMIGHTLSDGSQMKAVPNEDNSEDFSMEVAPDISLLALNATGELRYLGPSSGSFLRNTHPTLPGASYWRIQRESLRRAHNHPTHPLSESVCIFPQLIQEQIRCAICRHEWPDISLIAI